MRQQQLEEEDLVQGSRDGVGNSEDCLRDMTQRMLSRVYVIRGKISELLFRTIYNILDLVVYSKRTSIYSTATLLIAVYRVMNVAAQAVFSPSALQKVRSATPPRARVFS